MELTIKSITKAEFDDFHNAQKYHFPKLSPQPTIMSRARHQLTSLSINKYIFIVDNYKELKQKFKILEE